MFGIQNIEYLYSRTWSHRQDALLNITNDDNSNQYQGSPLTIFDNLCKIILIGMNDRVAQVVQAAVDMCKSVVKHYIPEKIDGTSANVS